MKSYQRSHFADQTLVDNLASSTARSREATADQIADIGEFDARKLYLPAGYASTYAYLVSVLHLPEQAALKRIYVARKARRFPAIYHAIADGRLHLTGVVVIGRHLTEANAAQLLAAIEHKTRNQIERIRAERFPQPDLPTLIERVAPPRPTLEMVATAAPMAIELSPGRVQIETPAPAIAPPIEEHPRITPRSPGRSHLNVMIDDETEEELRYGQTLLAHVIPSGDMVAVLKRLVHEGVMSLEKQKLGSESSGARANGGRSESRYIPTDVRREVWERDGGQCTFVSDDGHRCAERFGLQFDHIDPHALGGESTTTNIRLLCRAHNQFEAERTYGAEFMRHKRKRAAG